MHIGTLHHRTWVQQFSLITKLESCITALNYARTNYIYYYIYRYIQYNIRLFMCRKRKKTAAADRLLIKNIGRHVYVCVCLCVYVRVCARVHQSICTERPIARVIYVIYLARRRRLIRSDSYYKNFLYTRCRRSIYTSRDNVYTLLLNIIYICTKRRPYPYARVWTRSLAAVLEVYPIVSPLPSLRYFH